MRSCRRLDQPCAGLCLLLASLQLVSWTLAGEPGGKARIAFGGARETLRRVCNGEVISNGCCGAVKILGLALADVRM